MARAVDEVRDARAVLEAVGDIRSDTFVFIKLLAGAFSAFLPN